MNQNGNRAFSLNSRRTAFAAVLLLGLVSFLLYWPATRHGFVGLDDPTYVSENPHVQNALTWAGIVWAFTTGCASNWHPITWISHMLDCQLFGMNAGGHHFTGFLLHSINSMLLVLVLRQMTGAFWRSLFVGMLFAWHPLHVESVAWAAERKDVLSTFFFLLALGAYVRGVLTRRPLAQGVDSVPPEGPAYVRLPFVHYWLAFLFFALGLLSKPMLVTFPCVLLLVDVWPLKRLDLSQVPFRPGAMPWSTLRRLLVEKVPFFVLSFGASLVTYFVQKAGGAVSSLNNVAMGDRAANAIVAYSRYIYKTIVPLDLAVFYPLPAHWPFSTVAGGALVILALTIVCLRARRQYPYLAIGWLWFVGTLVPTIGLVQVGSQSMADRYMYIPSIGLFLVLAWGFHELYCACSRLKWIVPATAAMACAACIGFTSTQIGSWHDEETLFRHAAECVPDNYLAYDHLAKVYEASDRKEEALAFYAALLKLKPQYPEGQYNAGTLLLERGNLVAAEKCFRAAVQARPAFAAAHLNLGNTLVRQNRLAEAVAELKQALKLNSANPQGYLNLGVALLAMSRPAEAAKAFSAMLRLSPGSLEGQFLLAMALGRDRQFERAAVEAGKARDLASAAGRVEMAQKAEKLLQACRAGDSCTAAL